MPTDTDRLHALERIRACCQCIDCLADIDDVIASLTPPPAEGPQAMPEVENGDVVERTARSVKGGPRQQAEITAIERNGVVIWRAAAGERRA